MTPDDIGKALAAAKGYADLILKPPLEQVGGILSDTLGNFRLKNQVRMLLKTKTFLEERNVDPQKLLPDIFVPLMEEAGNTSDETLSDMFASLLASHLDPSQKDAVHPSFARVLGQLSALDVRILQLLDEKERKQWESREGERIIFRWDDYSITLRTKERFGDISAGQIRLSLENLERLGIVEDKTSSSKFIPFFQKGMGFIVTKFGHRLLLASNKPDYWRHEMGDIDERTFVREFEDRRLAKETHLKEQARKRKIDLEDDDG